MTLIFYALGCLLFILSIVALAHDDGLTGYLLWGLTSLCIGIAVGYEDYRYSQKEKGKR